MKTGEASVTSRPHSAWRTRAIAVAWSVGVFAIYLANGREISSGDTIPAKYLTLALLRGDGFYLDRYQHEACKYWNQPGIPYYLYMVDGHFVSHYPIGPALVALPFTVPQVLALDWVRPDWENSEPAWFDTIAKRSAAAISALVALALLVVLLKLGLGREAWLAATAAALGSSLWATASQSLWQHGPAALMLMLVILLLWGDSPSRLRIFVAGAAAAMLVCSRPIALAFAAVTAIWVAIRHPRALVWFLLPAAAIGAALVSYNRAYLGRPTGYYSQFDAANFATPFLDGLGGTLLSPSRGLFLFTPWTIVAFAYLPFAFVQLRKATLLPWLLVTLVAHAVLISTFTMWWAGHCFGPRFWTEVIPLIAIGLGMALKWAKQRARVIYSVSLVLVAGSIAVQILGVTQYPSGWQERPTLIDHAPERLWDWADSELTRCVIVSKAYQSIFGSALADKFNAAPPSQPPPPTQPDLRVSGYLDRVGCEKIDGWAWDPQRPATPISVEIYDGNRLVATVLADGWRQDLVEFDKGDGRHAFIIDTPAQLKDGKLHDVHAKAAGFGIELNWSPQPLKCPEAPAQFAR
jgi:hypothetical protein